MYNYQPYCIAFKPIGALRASEDVDAFDVRELALRIARAGVWTAPLPVDDATGIVMDGNHRLRAARLLGLRYLPCVPLSYQDPRVTVTHWTSGERFDVDHIFRSILAERGVLPYKTTRHLFAPVLPSTMVELDLLRSAGHVRDAEAA